MEYVLPKDIKKGMIVKILDTKTGKLHETDMGYTVWWWGAGNGSCDCNRCLELPETEEELTTEYGENACFGNNRFLIVDILNNGCDKIADKKDAIKFMNGNYPADLLKQYLPDIFGRSAVLILGENKMEKFCPEKAENLHYPMIPEPRGAGRSYVNEIIKSLSDDEVVRCFERAYKGDKLPFFNEIRRRGIKSIIIDLELDQEDQKELAFEDVGGVGMSYFSLMTGITMESIQDVDGGVSLEERAKECRKTSAHLLKKKEVKFYQTLNKKRFR